MTTLHHAPRSLADYARKDAAWQAGEESMRALADAMPQIVWSAQPDGFLDYYNARWYEFTGFPRGAGGDESWVPILHPDDLQPCMEAWYDAVRTGEPYEIEYRFHDRRTGGYRWYLGRALPVRDAQGRVERWFGTCTDIHEHKEALRALEAQSAAMHAADRRKNEFIAMLAHELRNPLASMTSALALLHTDHAEDRAWAAEVLERQTGQLTRLIDDLLDVARISSGKMDLRKEPLDLATVLDRAVETVRPAVTGQRHELTTDYPRRQLYVNGDPARLEQIIVNVLANAAKYTPPEGHLALRASRVDGHVVVAVQDDGLGIASARLPAIFDIYTQGERSVPQAKDGLGLGLTIVQKLAELHGGAVSATSGGPGLGSEFKVSLPACTADSSAPPAPLPPSPAAPPPHARILVVDDHADSADALARLLRRRGYEAEIAYDGVAALAAARAFQPEVILLDLDLPHIDGCEVAVRLRSDPAHRRCLLIALTGFGQEEDRQRALAAGFDQRFVKPVDLDVLQGFISDSLQKS